MANLYTGSNLKIVVIGASGGIGSALVEILAQEPSNTLYALARTPTNFNAPNVACYPIDYNNEASLDAAAAAIGEQGAPDWVIVATGILHDDEMTPEKSLRDLTAEKLQKNFLVNCIGPALAAKHFLPKFAPSKKAIFAVLSARVGSISDNRLGGWYAYRASKSALNMLIKTASIETARRNKHAVVVGLHPGTVDTRLSAPFQARVPSDKLFTAKFSANKLIEVINSLTAADSGKIFAWDGQQIPY